MNKKEMQSWLKGELPEQKITARINALNALRLQGKLPSRLQKEFERLTRQLESIRRKHRAKRTIKSFRHRLPK